MGKLFNKLPLYEATITDDETGMFNISLVDYPAVELNWLAFAAQPQSFAVQDEDKHLILGCVMTANKPIYRISPKGEEYYIVFTPETIRVMAEKYLKDGCQNNVDTDHNFKFEEGCFMTQWFIKDTEKGIAPEGFDCEDGSLFCEFHITNEDIWDKIKDGTFKGFSLAGYFDMEESMRKETELDSCINILNKIISKLVK